MSGTEVYCPLQKHCSSAQLYASARGTLKVPRNHSIRLWLAVPFIGVQGEFGSDVIKALTDRPLSREMLACTLYYFMPTAACSS